MPMQHRPHPIVGAASRRGLLIGMAGAIIAVATPARAAAEGWAQLARGPVVVLMRHTSTEPGVGDPPGFRLDSCATQRNLSDVGRQEARALGAEVRRRGIVVDRMLTSAWCRCRDTAAAMAVAPVEDFPALNSVFADRASATTAQTRELRRFVAAWRGPGVAWLVTHQVNISALTGVATAMGEALVLAPSPTGDAGFEIVGRLRP